ncbi:MAG: hypothetical protein FWD74_03725, partial [Actinomycetia bacterium]|nr:hypothetical protein [Actinomycetes bacterium]
MTKAMASRSQGWRGRAMALPERSEAWRARARPHWPVAALTAIALAWYLFRAVATHQRFLTTGYDL